MTTCINNAENSTVQIPGFIFHSADNTRLQRTTIVNSSSAVIPNRVKYISSQAFTSSLATNITFETNSNLTTVDEYAFENSIIVNIQFPSIYSQLNSRLLYGITSIETVDFLGSVTKIPALCFYNNKNLKSIQITDILILSNNTLDLTATLIEDIGREAFYGVSFSKIIVSSFLSDHGSIGLFDNVNLETVIFQNPLPFLPPYIFSG
jgi:hypothetical protein